MSPLIDEATRAMLFEEIPKMEGWLTPERAVEMYELVRLVRPTTVVELGVFAGRSLIAQALALRDNGHGKIFGIDPWKLENALEGSNDEANSAWWSKNVDLHLMHRQTMESIWKHKLDEYAIIVRAASQHLPRLFPGGIDVLNIDAAHSELASCRDVNNYVPQVNRNGWVWMDDCDWPTMKKAQELMLEWCDEQRVSDDGHYKLYCVRKYEQEFEKA